LAAGVLVLLLAAGWALMPLDRVEVPVPELPTPGLKAAQTGSESSLDLGAFDVVLWHDPPPPPTAEPSPASDPKPRAQSVLADARSRFELIAIVRESGGALRASLYDRQQDRMVSLARGDALTPQVRIGDVHAAGLVIASGSETASLNLIKGPKLVRHTAGGDRP
jgi:hypothetical protein